MAAIPALTKKRPLSDDQDNPSADQKKKKPANEIDEIFQARKAKKQPKEEAQPKSSDGSSKPNKSGEVGSGDKKKTKKKKKKKGAPPVVEETAEARARRRRTGDGLTIYSAEELGFGNPDAGGTPLCPFDCSCCF